MGHPAALQKGAEGHRSVTVGAPRPRRGHFLLMFNLNLPSPHPSASRHPLALSVSSFAPESPGRAAPYVTSLGCSRDAARCFLAPSEGREGSAQRQRRRSDAVPVVSRFTRLFPKQRLCCQTSALPPKQPHWESTHPHRPLTLTLPLSPLFQRFGGRWGPRWPHGCEMSSSLG